MNQNYIYILKSTVSIAKYTPLADGMIGMLIGKPENYP